MVTVMIANGTLRVRNLAQQMLWNEELCGQISDGFWENATPQDHYKSWCSATVVIDPDHVGRDFYARRQSYNFTSKDLLDIVGDRMLGYVQTVIPDYTMTDMRRDLKDLKVIIKQYVSPELPVPPQPEFFEGQPIDDASAPAPARTFTFADFDTQAV